MSIFARSAILAAVWTATLAAVWGQGWIAAACLLLAFAAWKVAPR
jgi:hypothetical protein